MKNASRLLAAFLLLAAVCASSAAEQPPNIVLILSDDQGWSGTSVQMDPNNPESRSDYFETPNLERLASRGMRFSRAYTAAAICSASRAALQ